MLYTLKKNRFETCFWFKRFKIIAIIIFSPFYMIVSFVLYFCVFFYFSAIKILWIIIIWTLVYAANMMVLNQKSAVQVSALVFPLLFTLLNWSSMCAPVTFKNYSDESKKNVETNIFGRFHWKQTWAILCKFPRFFSFFSMQFHFMVELRKKMFFFRGAHSTKNKMTLSMNSVMCKSHSIKKNWLIENFVKWHNPTIINTLISC